MSLTISEDCFLKTAPGHPKVKPILLLTGLCLQTKYESATKLTRCWENVKGFFDAVADLANKSVYRRHDLFVTRMLISYRGFSNAS